jgi:hypothetical protein
MMIAIYINWLQLFGRTSSLYNPVIFSNMALYYNTSDEQEISINGIPYGKMMMSHQQPWTGEMVNVLCGDRIYRLKYPLYSTEGCVF